MLAVVIGIFLVFLILGAPICMAMGIGVLPYFILEPGVTGITIAQKMFAACDSFSLMAIPFFMLAGNLMEHAGIISEMIRWSNCLVGHIKGGLAQTATVAGVILAGVSGSANADAAALGSMLLPTMKESGYDQGFSVVCISTAAGLGPIIPPSINMVIFCSITGLSTGKMFEAGIIPGLMMAACYMCYNYYYASKAGMKSGKFCGMKVLGRTTWEALPALLMPVIIVGGILGGVFTPTEAGVAACLYGVGYGFATKKLNLKSLHECAVGAGVSTTGCMSVIMVSTVLSYALARLGVSAFLESFCHQYISSAIMFMLFVVIINVISGCFIDANAWMMMMVPILWPIAMSYGIEPLQFGLVFIISLLTGGITPPVGMYLMIICGVDGTPIQSTFRYVIPFLLLELFVVAILMVSPGIVTFLPNLLVA